MDGDDDILFQSSGNDNNLTLLENKIGQDNNWIAIKLSGPDSGVNGSAIGARIRVHTPTFMKMRDIYAGEGNFSGQSPFILNFGLGTQRVDSIEVIWPNINSDTQVVYEPGINQMINIEYPCGDQ